MNEATLSPDSIRLDGRVIIVAGAGGGGIGTASAALLAQAGATVIAVDRSEASGAAARTALEATGGRYRLVGCDLADIDQVRAMIAGVEQRDGPVRGVLNVVGGMQGTGQFAPLLAPGGDEIFRNIVDFNLRATFNSSVEAARAMARRGEGGSLVQIASATGLSSMAYGGGYGAAKAALLNLTRTMAVEWGRYGIRANAIAVGMIRTAQSQAAVKEVEEAARVAVPLGRVGRSDEIAGAVLFLMSDLASYVTGATLSVDGGSTARAPYNDGDNLPVFVNDPTLRATVKRLDAEAIGDPGAGA
jgi:NAD(P)-dependent dehydrogenase (short-subunit alcohol dehydrogenase family)